MGVQIENGCVQCACLEAQKNVIREKLKEGRRKELLILPDYAHFFAVNVKQSSYKDLVGFLNRQAKKGALIKTNPGRGSYAAYVFPADILISMVDEVVEEKMKGTNHE